MGPPFAWSWSRHRTFLRCERQYAFDYYVARRGRRRDADPRAVEIARLRSLVTPPQWVGQVVHSLAERALKAARSGPGAVDAARASWRADVARALESTNGPTFEASVYPELPAEDRGAILADALDQGEALLAHPLMRRLLAVPERIVEVEQHRQLRLGGLRVIVALDVLVRDPAGGLVVIDWKTGARPEEVDPGQLALYVAAVAERFRAPTSRITALIGGTRTGAFYRVPVEEHDVAGLLTEATASAAGMRARLSDPDHDRAEESSFPRLPVGHETCARCVYRRACRDHADIFCP